MVSLTPIRRRSVLFGSAVCAVTPGVWAQQKEAMAPAQSALQFKLEEAASFSHQATGVACSPDGRVFVNFPRWTEDAPVSVAEVMKDGTLRPYPDEEWNTW